MAAPLIRRSDGFDAELLLAALRPAAEARYLAVLAASRGRPTGLAAPLLDLLARSSISISERMVALEALGTHGAAAEHAAAAVDALAATLASAAADGGARAVACRALSQLAAQAIDGGRELRAALGGAVGSLAVALEKDGCRYARAHAAEALASIVVAHAAGGDGALDAAAAFAAAVLRDGGGLAAADVDACARARRRRAGRRPRLRALVVCAAALPADDADEPVLGCGMQRTLDMYALSAARRASGCLRAGCRRRPARSRWSTGRGTAPIGVSIRISSGVDLMSATVSLMSSLLHSERTAWSLRTRSYASCSGGKP